VPGVGLKIGCMPNPYESARLNLQLFEMRREPVLREARSWFTRDFNPETLAELIALVGGERNASFRMVLGYWDMAASLVTSGAIEREAFLAAHGEIFLTFSKIAHILDSLREASGERDFCAHIEQVVMSHPGADELLARRRAAGLAAMKARDSSSPSSAR
jgi:hypothetical protein